MTISSTTNRVTLTGNGVTVDIPFPYAVFADTDLVVIETIIATGVQTTKTLTTHYTFSGTPDAAGHYPDGGIVTAVTAPASTVTWTVYRDPLAIQGLDLVENDGAPAEAQEAQFDYLTMLIQRVKEQINRTMQQPEGDSATIDRLPSKVDRASLFLAFDTDGDPIASPGTTAVSTPISAFMATVLDDADAATARTTLDTSQTTPLDSVFQVVGSSDATKKLAFEVDGLTTATTRTLTVQDKNGTLALTSEFDYANLAGASGRMPFPPKFLNGLTYANNAGDATNDLDIAAGFCRDATNAHNLILSALTKQSDVAWAVGTNQGLLDTGAVGNSDYYLWAIKRSDTGVCDVLASLSSTAPTMPANYDVKRLIGWFKRSGGTIVAFRVYETDGGGVDFAWDSPTLDVDLSNTLTTAKRTDALKVPQNLSVMAHFNLYLNDASASQLAWIYCPDQTDLAPSTTAGPLANAQSLTTSGFNGQLSIRTSATGTIAARSTLATVDTYRVSTLGFTWARRN